MWLIRAVDIRNYSFWFEEEGEKKLARKSVSDAICETYIHTTTTPPLVVLMDLQEC